MRIDFSKTISGPDLERYVSENAPELCYGPEYVIKMNQDRQGLEKDLIDAFYEKFEQGGFTLTRTSSKNLWISAPYQFSLGFETDVDYKLERIGTYPHEVKYGWFGDKKKTIQLPLYKQGDGGAGAEPGRPDPVSPDPRDSRRGCPDRPAVEGASRREPPAESQIQLHHNAG